MTKNNTSLLREFKPKSKNQAEYIRSIIESELVFCIGPAGTGKALLNGTIIYTPSGPIPIEKLSIGDIVCTPNGDKSKITGVFPQGIKQIYRIHFKNGSYIDCCGEHLWRVGYNSGNHNLSGSMVVDTKFLYKNHKSKSGRNKYFVPISQPCNFDKQDILLDPYLLGVLIGDGCFTKRKSGLRFSSNDNEIIQKVKEIILQYNCMIKQSENEDCDYRIINAVKNTHIRNRIIELLEKYNLAYKYSYEKFIPNPYLYNEVNIRLDLLRGLLDTDGSIGSDGTIEYTTTSNKLAEDVKELVHSLGGICRYINRITQYTYKNIKKNGRVSYRLYIKFNNGIIPFSINRKVERIKTRTKYRLKHVITKVEKLGKAECTCIAIDDKEKLYLTKDFIPTHNTAVAVGIGMEYLANGKCAKLVITRPTVGVGDKLDRDIGYLPGGIREKMEPYLRPIFDELATYLPKTSLEGLIRDGIIEIAPLNFMRGRTFHDSFVIVDEGQNLTHKHIQMLTTRIGSRSKMIINGDMEQHDRDEKKCALETWIYEIVNDDNDIAICYLDKSDIVRSDIVRKVLERLERWERGNASIN